MIKYHDYPLRIGLFGNISVEKIIHHLKRQIIFLKITLNIYAKLEFINLQVY